MMAVMSAILASRRVALEHVLWLLAQAALLAAVGIGPLGWTVGSACAVVTLLLLARAVGRTGGPGPADRVTLGRALLSGCAAALVVERVDAAVVLTAVAALALVLDLVDGQVARRTGTASETGARFDMEVDAFLILVLSVHAAPSFGPWVLLIGLMRYFFVLAARIAPWLRAPLPPSRARKLVAAYQGVCLVAVVLFPWGWLLGSALVALVWSFGRDVRWLWVRRNAPAPPVQSVESTLGR
jgi:phosphatidylglycerophosphate synthase